MRNLITLCIICTLLQGCSFSNTMKVDVLIPNIETKDIQITDPTESRHTLQGNKTDRFLRKMMKGEVGQ